MKWIGATAATTALMRAGAASAQSNVTLYGKLDIGACKAIGSDSRLGFRGTEDLGGARGEQWSIGAGAVKAAYGEQTRAGTRLVQ